MAELVFSTIGRAVGGQMAPNGFSAFGAAFGQAAGAMLGRSIDNNLFGANVRREGPRLTDVHLQGGGEGASMPLVYGRVRIAGQVIWAARFKEHKQTREISSGGGGKGGGGGARTTSTEYFYTLSFAIGLCEGEIARIGRVWANGEAFDASSANMRIYRGTEDQEADPLIETIESPDFAPAFRGLAYVVFEDLPLAAFGNSIPQLSFEIIRSAPGAGAQLEDKIKGVCLIPGSGEFVYATEVVRRNIGPGQETPENCHVEQGRANLLVSLDQLKSDLPNCTSVLLVVSWFGADLRAGHCTIKPGVELNDKATSPMSWRVNGVTRGGAHVVSLHDGAPAFGGTPDDASVIAAIGELKARGYSVGLYPFVLMDVPASNGLTDPYGGAEQAAYPWRGRVCTSPALQKTAAIAAEVSAFFGAAAPADFGVSGGAVTYSGPGEYSYRRFILHYAKLAALAGGVDAFILGSELRGVTQARSSATAYPAVSALKMLAADVRGLVGGATKLTYAADWSEYFGHHPNDGSGDVFFHLDPLWSDSNIDVIGLDWYQPLSDWRDGAGHLDAEIARDDTDLAYLQARIESGENADWYYANDAAREAQTRSVISDGAYDEPWIYRSKSLRDFWSRAHHDRPGGVRSATPTDWVPESKPFWFVEFGCPAVDKGANAPNLFVDDKSDESALPPFSTGARDDLIQRRMLEVYLSYWDMESGHNPNSSIDDWPMIDPDGMFVWAWDARPHPAFPARADVWSDGGAWRRGHWLNGRAGLANLSDVVSELCARAGVTEIDASSLAGAVSGFIADAPSPTRAALEPLMAAYAFDAREHEGQIVFAHRGAIEPLVLSLDQFTAESVIAPQIRADPAETPIEARVSFIDPARDYAIATISARRLDRAEGGVETIAAPLCLEADRAEAIAGRLLAERRAETETLQAGLGLSHLALEPGDVIALENAPLDVFQITRISEAEVQLFEGRRLPSAGGRASSLAEPSAPAQPILAPTPAYALLDLPPLPGVEDDERPLFAAFASPWTGGHELYLGPSDARLTRRARATQAAIMGELLWALYPGPIDRWDDGNVVRVKIYNGALQSVTKDALLDGANVFAIESDAGEWEIVQARACVLVAPNEYQLSDFLRGLQGSAHAMRSPAPVGARIIKLDPSLARATIAAHEWHDVLRLAAPPAGGNENDARAARASVTPPHAWARPWAPAHLKARRAASSDVSISWVRCARIGGDFWGPGEPPLNEPAEAYRLEIWDMSVSGGVLKRSLELAAPVYLYSAALQTADFGGLPGAIGLRVGQIGADGLPGLMTEMTISL
jgi:hypothetical protein